MLIFEFVGQRGEAVSGCFREGHRRLEEMDPRRGSEYRVQMIVRVPSQLN